MLGSDGRLVAYGELWLDPGEVEADNDAAIRCYLPSGFQRLAPKRRHCGTKDSVGSGCG